MKLRSQNIIFDWIFTHTKRRLRQSIDAVWALCICRILIFHGLAFHRFIFRFCAHAFLFVFISTEKKKHGTLHKLSPRKIFESSKNGTGTTDFPMSLFQYFSKYHFSEYFFSFVSTRHCCHSMCVCFAFNTVLCAYKMYEIAIFQAIVSLFSVFFLFVCLKNKSFGSEDLFPWKEWVATHVARTDKHTERKNYQINNINNIKSNDVRRL